MGQDISTNVYSNAAAPKNTAAAKAVPEIWRSVEAKLPVAEGEALLEESELVPEVDEELEPESELELVDLAPEVEVAVTKPVLVEVALLSVLLDRTVEYRKYHIHVVFAGRVFACLTNVVTVSLAGLSIEVEGVFRAGTAGVLDIRLDALGLGGTDSGDLSRVACVLAIGELVRWLMTVGER